MSSKKSNLFITRIKWPLPSACKQQQEKERWKRGTGEEKERTWRNEGKSRSPRKEIDKLMVKLEDFDRLKADFADYEDKLNRLYNLGLIYNEGFPIKEKR